MMKKLRAMVALMLALTLFSGCGLSDYVHARMADAAVTPYDEIEYRRPDPEVLARTLEESCRVARTSPSLEDTENAIYAYYDEYDRFFTALAIADIELSKDMTSEKWAEEYEFCLSVSSQAEAGLEELYCALAQSPVRAALEGEDYFGPGYFDAYEGEGVMDEGYLALSEKENRLISRYYDLAEEYGDLEFGGEAYLDAAFGLMMELFVELVRVRQEIAEYCGYDSYAEYAYDFSFYRDYTPGESREYLQALRAALLEPYRAVNASDIWDRVSGRCGEGETFDYVRRAARAMGGEIAEGFEVLDRGGLYDIGPGQNKFESSFEVYLWSYHEPFIFMNPTQTPVDKLSFAHEFGHFLNDHLCWGSYAGTDVAEVHSQAMEYLSLCYNEDTELLREYKLADALCTYMESGAMALFELEVYDLAGEELTAERAAELYEQICLSFGFDSWDNWDSRSFITVGHFFTEPMYMISYVVSNDLAVQIYQRELDTPGQGLELYRQTLYSQDSYIISFAEGHGLTSPFAPGRVEALQALFG